MAIRGVKVNRATRAVMVRGNYPHLYGEPIPGYDIVGTATEEWLIVDEPVSPENILYDSRYYHLLTSENAIPGDVHPIYPGVGRFHITYSTPKMPIESILLNLENAENNANYQAFPTEKQLKIMCVAIRAGYKKSIGLNVTAIEQAAFDLFNDYTAKLIDNFAAAQAKAVLIQQNQEPDMDSGWVI